jgi:hypothetical protein
VQDVPDLLGVCAERHVWTQKRVRAATIAFVACESSRPIEARDSFHPAFDDLGSGADRF